MFDFRYHALSLVAVFLALGIGILLGSTIGDNLASQANKDLSSSSVLLPNVPANKATHAYWIYWHQAEIVGAKR